MMNPLGCQRGKSGIEFGSHMLCVVVVVQYLQRPLPLLRRIKGTRRKLFRVYGDAGDSPINIFDRGVVDNPGSHPAIESQRDESIFLVGVTRRERLELVEG